MRRNKVDVIFQCEADVFLRPAVESNGEDQLSWQGREIWDFGLGERCSDELR
jgi:hypothetical protein